MTEALEIQLMTGAQKDFFLSEAKHPAMLAGRGSGKTYALVTKGFALAMKYPGIRGCLT